VKSSPPLVAAHDHMVERSVKLHSGLSRHAGTVSGGKSESQITQYSGLTLLFLTLLFSTFL
jgi:hypothetical protein